MKQPKSSSLIQIENYSFDFFFPLIKKSPHEQRRFFLAEHRGRRSDAGNCGTSPIHGQTPLENPTRDILSRSAQQLFVLRFLQIIFLRHD